VTSCLVLIGCLLAGQADAAPDEQLPLQVRRLTRQLDSDLLAEREAAERELIALGPAVLDVLPTPGRNTSAEVSVRLARVRNVLQTEQAQAAAQPSRVTLQGEMPLSAALEALQQQTGNRIVDFRPRQRQQQTDPQVTADFDQTPFWQALDNLLDQAQLTVYNFSGEQGAVALVARSETETDRSSRAAYAGVFRVEGVSIQAVRDLRNAANRTLQLTIQVTWEPRISPIVLQVPLGDIRAVDGTGQAIGVDARLSRLEVPVEQAIPEVEITIPLELPDRSVREIAALTGSLSALVPGRIEAFAFDDLEQAKSVEQQRAGVTVILDQVRKNAAVHEARVRVRFADAENALESHRGWVYKNEAYLTNAAGEREEPIGMQTFRQTPDEVGVAFLFDGQLDLSDFQFVYETPATLVKMPVQYELQGIPLP
jgi:hypothetical protein